MTDFMDFDGPWAYIIQHEDVLTKIIKRACGKRQDLVEEMAADVIPRAVIGAFRTFDANKGSLHTHVRNAVRLHTLKWWWRYRRNQVAELNGHEDPTYENRDVSDLENADQVLYLLEQLNDTYRTVVELRTYHGLTFYEIGVRIGVGKTTARGYYITALDYLRQLLNEQ